MEEKYQLEGSEFWIFLAAFDITQFFSKILRHSSSFQLCNCVNSLQLLAFHPSPSSHLYQYFKPGGPMTDVMPGTLYLIGSLKPHEPGRYHVSEINISH